MADNQRLGLYAMGNDTTPLVSRIFDCSDRSAMTLLFVSKRQAQGYTLEKSGDISHGGRFVLVEATVT